MPIPAAQLRVSHGTGYGTGSAMLVESLNSPLPLPEVVPQLWA